MLVCRSPGDNPADHPVCSARAVVQHLRYPPCVTPGLADLLAHQGGWDELLMVAVPVAVFGVLLRSANRRAQRQRDGHDDQGHPPEAPTRRGPI